MSNFSSELNDFDTGTIFEWSLDYLDFEENRTKARPVPEVIRTGLAVGEPWARIWHNDAFFNHGQYLNWLSGAPVIERDVNGTPTQVENFEPVGTVKTIDQDIRIVADDKNGGTLTAFTITDAATYWGGTWTRLPDLGTGTVEFTKTGMDFHADNPLAP